MGCCGGNKNRTPSTRVMRAAARVGAVAASGRTAGAFSAQSLPGEQGMVMLEYLLAKSGSVPYYGASTGTMYVFGGQRRLGYVDVRDADAFLEMVEGHRQTFRLYKAAVPIAPEFAGLATQAEPDPALLAGTIAEDSIRDALPASDVSAVDYAAAKAATAAPPQIPMHDPSVAVDLEHPSRRARKPKKDAN